MSLRKVTYKFHMTYDNQSHTILKEEREGVCVCEREEGRGGCCVYVCVGRHFHF